MFIPLKDYNPTRRPAELVGQRNVEIPALVFLVIWFAFQFLSASGGSGIAWLAHVGGFVLGFLLVKLFLDGKKPVAEIVP